MSNPYYDHTTYPASGASGSSAALRAELDAIEAGFDKLPVLSGNALKLVRVNAGATALEASDAAASGVACTPSGNLASTNVQAALVELQGDIDSLGGFSLDADLAAIAALTGTGFAKRTGTNTWSLSSSVALGSEVSGTLGVGNGGTGQISFTNGQLLIGNSTGNTLTKATLTAGAGIAITNGAGSISIGFTGVGQGADVASANTLDLSGVADQVVRITGTTGINAVTLANGHSVRCVFQDVCKLTYNGTTMNIDTTALDYYTAADDIVDFTAVSGVIYGVITRSSHGAVVSSQVTAAAAVSLTNNTAVQVASIYLPPGEWDVSGHTGYVSTATTNVTTLRSLISDSVAFDVDAKSIEYRPFVGGVVINTPASGTPIQGLNTARWSVGAGGKTLYLVAFCGFTVSTLKAFGYIQATRVS